MSNHQDWGFPDGIVVKNLPVGAGGARDVGLVLGSGRSPGGGHSNPLQYSCLENPCGQRSLASHSPWGCKESDTPEQLKHINTRSEEVVVVVAVSPDKHLIILWIQALGCVTWEQEPRVGTVTSNPPSTWVGGTQELKKPLD